MELFKLFGIIEVNNKSANDALDETSEKGQKAESKLSKVMTGLGKGAAAVGKAVGAGMVVAGTAVAGLATQSIQAYASYEQLVGGVDTLFKESSGKVQEYARNAYKTAGLSANEYMETVTSFSASLLQSLGGDTEKAADKANTAITDMSDNANKMGTTMEMIQNAYNGFAKQNYTMLDNLKLGYGGTKEEMQRLLADAEKLSGQKFDISSYADVVDAIHVIQTEMGITGTTALEASETISGSAGSVKAAWQDLMVAFISDDLSLDTQINNFVASVSTMAENLIPKIGVALGGIVQMIDKLAPQILAKFPEILSQLLPSILEAATGLLNSFVTILPQTLQTIISVISSYAPTLFSTFGNLITGIADYIQTNLPIITEKAREMMEGLGAKIQENLPSFISKGLDILMGLSETILQNIPVLASIGMEMIMSLVKGIVASLPELIAKAPQIITNFANTISRSMQTILVQGAQIVWELIKGIVGAIPDLIANFPKVIEAIFSVWNAINWMNLGKNLMNGIKDGIKNLGGTLKETATNVFNDLKTNVGNIFTNIQKAITSPILTAKTKALAVVGELQSAFINVAKGLLSKVGTVFNSIKTAITNPIQTAKTTIKGIVDAIKGFFTNFKISIPKIPMPHFGVSPSGWKIGDLLKGSIPKLSIQWYAEAMRNPMIMTKPTVFGYDAQTGKFLGGGEAGSEVVTGTGTLMNMIGNAVAIQNEALAYYLQKIVEILAAYFPQVIEALDMDIVLDDGVLVGRLAPAMDFELGRIKERKGRGR